MWKKILALLMGLSLGFWMVDDFNPESVRGKNVLVTGASTGIGEQLAYHYARLGANVVITARRENKLKEVISRCKELGEDSQTFHYIVADMLDLNATEAVVKGTVNILGGLDYLVLNHIVLLKLGTWEGSAHNISLIDMVFKVNFDSYVHLASHSLPHLEKTRGSMVVVSSLAGKLGQPFVSIYSASKFALDGFFGGLRQELMLKNCDISVTLCVIGLIGTENAVNQLQDFGQDFLLRNIKPALPSDTALAIIKGGATRKREMYYPYLQVKPFVLLRDWCPSLLEYINRNLYTFHS